MRALCALCLLLIIGAATAAADSTATPSTAPEAAEAAAAIAAADAEAAIAEAEAELAGAQQELAAAQAELAQIDSEQVRAEIEAALASADTAQAPVAIAGAEAALVAAKSHLDELQTALEELRASGDLTAAGADKLKSVLDKLQSESSVYTLRAPLAHGMPGFPGTAQFYGLDGQFGKEWTEKLQAMPQFKQQLFDKELFKHKDFKQLYFDGDKLEQLKELKGMQLKKLEDLTPQKRAEVEKKIAALKEKGVYSFAQPGEDGKVYVLPKQFKAGHAWNIPLFDASELMNGKHDGLFFAPKTFGQNFYFFGAADGKALVIKLNDDGTVDVQGPGYSEDELARIRETLNNSGVAELLKQQANDAPQAPATPEPNV